MLKNIILTLILIATVIGGFVNSPIEFSVVEGTCVTFINSGIQLSINNKMGITVYFNKNDCEKVQTKIGYHSKSTMIEVWGLGNGWYMWIDYDFI